MKIIGLCILIILASNIVYASENAYVVSGGLYYKLTTDNTLTDEKIIKANLSEESNTSYAIVGEKLLTIISLGGNEVLAIVNLHNFTVEKVIFNDMSNMLDSDVRIVKKPTSNECLIMYSDKSGVDKAILVDMITYLKQDLSNKFPDKDSFIKFTADGSKYVMVAEEDCLFLKTVDLVTGDSIRKECLAGRLGAGLPWRIIGAIGSQMLISVSDKQSSGVNYIENHNIDTGDLITTVSIGNDAAISAIVVADGLIVNKGTIVIEDAESQIINIIPQQKIVKYDFTGKQIKEINIDGNINGRIVYSNSTNKLYAIINSGLNDSSNALIIIDPITMKLINKINLLGNNAQIYLE